MDVVLANKIKPEWWHGLDEEIHPTQTPFPLQSRCNVAAHTRTAGVEQTAKSL